MGGKKNGETVRKKLASNRKTNLNLKEETGKGRTIFNLS